MKPGALPENIRHAGHCLLGEFDALDRDRTIFILPVGSLEAHGWHLPNDTDMTSAVVMAEQTGILFARAHRDWMVVLLPLLNIGTDELPLPGSIEFSRGTVYRALVEYGRSLKRWGFKNLVLTNGHGGPKHNLALDDACRTCNRRYGMRMTSPGILVYQDFIFGKKFPLLEEELGRKLKPFEKKGLVDIEHAAGWETSIILNESPELVAADYREYGSSMLSVPEAVRKAARFLEAVVKRIPLLKGALGALGLPLEEGVRLLLTADKMYHQKKPWFTYSGDPSVGKADIGRAWKMAVSKEIVRLIGGVYITGERKPSSIVSNYSAIIFLRRDFMHISFWAIVFLIAAAAVMYILTTGGAAL